MKTSRASIERLGESLDPNDQLESADSRLPTLPGAVLRIFSNLLLGASDLVFGISGNVRTTGDAEFYSFHSFHVALR